MTLPQVSNPYAEYHVFFRTQVPLLDFVEDMEQKTGLFLMGNKDRKTLNGFATKFANGIMLSLYTKDKSIDEDVPYEFKSVEFTKELEDKIHGS